MSDIGEVELGLIAQDTADLLGLVLRIGNNPAYAVIGLGISPFAALVAEESYGYVTDPARHQISNALNAPLFANFADTVTKLRARVKLFDDSRGGMDALIETLSLAYRKSHGWFMRPHRGMLGGLKRCLQPDLGIFYIGEHVLGTTHMALITVGLTHERLIALDPANMRDVGTFVNEFSHATGNFLAQLVTYLNGCGIDLRVSASHDQRESQLLITHSDHYGRLAYDIISEKLGLILPELSTTVVFLVAQLNFVERVLSCLLPPSSSLLLRARFLTAYHAARALRELEMRDGHADNMLGRLARTVLNEPDTQFLLGARQVRNVLAHYELRQAAQFLTVRGDPLNDVLTGLCQKGTASVAEIAQRQTLRIADAFAGLISKSSLRKSRALLGDHT